MPMLSLAHVLLLLVAAIWGFAFVAQSAGMDHIGPHSFNAARFILAALSLLPLWLLARKRRAHAKAPARFMLVWGLLAGSVLFAGFTLQQIGLLHTSAGNARFITGMYIVFVPLVGVLLGQKTQRQTWLGLALAVLGLYSLTMTDTTSIRYGDALVLVGALFWTAHVLVIGHVSHRVDAVAFSIVQFVVAAVWASLCAWWLETPSMTGFDQAWWPLVYAGVASSGIAFTLQSLAQRHVEPSITALILSFEAVFAVLGGYLMLGEAFGAKEALGCGLMLMGMLVTQWPSKKA